LTKKSINVGIIGFGTVGTGTAKILLENADIIRRRLGAPVKLKTISDLDTKRDRGIKLGDVKLTADVKDILGDPDIDVVVAEPFLIWLTLRSTTPKIVTDDCADATPA